VLSGVLLSLVMRMRGEPLWSLGLAVVDAIALG
jgi:hypothetical protein